MSRQPKAKDIARRKISVCIVAYNNLDDIINNLKSLYKYTDTSDIDLQVYISDNNTSVSSASDVISALYPNVQIVKNDINRGYGSGHNAVLKNNLDSDYHLILNPDIEFTEDTINELKSILDNDDSIAIITPELRNRDGSIQHVPRLYPKLRYVLSSTVPFMEKYRDEYTMKNKTVNSSIEIDICTGAFMFIRTSVFSKIGGFDERFFMYFEDFDLSIRARNYGRIIYYPLTSVKHLWHRDSKKSKKMFMIQVSSMIKFYKKWALGHA